MFARIERLNIPHEAGSVSSSFWLILAAERKIIRLGEQFLVRACLCASESGEKAEFLAELHGLRPSSSPEFVENTARMGLNRALAHKKLRGDLAVAQSTGYQFKDLQLTASQLEILSFSFVRDERSPGRNRDILHNNCLPFSC